MERGWRITAWSRERGRGTIASDAGTLDFDASVALVDDFTPGELVDIALDHGAVRRIQPRAARSPVATIEPRLADAWTTAVAAANAALDALAAVVVTAYADERLRIEIQHADWPDRSPRCTLALGEVTYLQLPMRALHVHRVTARVWADVVAARPAWLANMAIDADEVERDAVLLCFEPATFGVPAGFVIAGTVAVA